MFCSFTNPLPRYEDACSLLAQHACAYSCIIVSFHTHAEALAANRILKREAVQGCLAPLPRFLSAECGYVWRASFNQFKTVFMVLQAGAIDYETLFVVS